MDWLDCLSSKDNNKHEINMCWTQYFHDMSDKMFELLYEYATKKKKKKFNHILCFIYIIGNFYDLDFSIEF